MPIARLNPDSVWKPKKAFSQVVKAQGSTIVVTSGQVAYDRDGQLVGKNDVKAQTRQALENLKAVLAEAGASLDDVVKVTIYLADIGDAPKMNEVRAEYFERTRPASTTVKAEMVSKELLVEIEALAVI